MEQFELIHIINDKVLEDRLEDLERRCKDLNGWSKKELLQYAVASVPLERIYLNYLEDMVLELESEKKQDSFFKDIAIRFKGKK